LFDDAAGKAFLFDRNALWIDERSQGIKSLIQNRQCKISDVLPLTKKQRVYIENMSLLINAGVMPFSDSVECTPVQRSTFRHKKVRQLFEEGYMDVSQTKSFNVDHLRNLRCTHLLIKAGAMPSKTALALTLM